jgi:hypothetical protein
MDLQTTLQRASSAVEQGGGDDQKKNAHLADHEVAGSLEDNRETGEKREMFCEL